MKLTFKGEREKRRKGIKRKWGEKTNAIEKMISPRQAWSVRRRVERKREVFHPYRSGVQFSEPVRLSQVQHGWRELATSSFGEALFFLRTTSPTWIFFCCVVHFLFLEACSGTLRFQNMSARACTFFHWIWYKIFSSMLSRWTRSAVFSVRNMAGLKIWGFSGSIETGISGRATMAHTAMKVTRTFCVRGLFENPNISASNTLLAIPIILSPDTTHMRGVRRVKNPFSTVKLLVFLGTSNEVQQSERKILAGPCTEYRRRMALMQEELLSSSTTSMWIARVVRHVKRMPQRFFVALATSSASRND